MGNSDVLKKSPGFKKISANTVIVREGVSNNEKMYIILSGGARVYKDFKKPGEVLISELTAGDFFGEMSLFLGKPQSATVVASSDMMVAELTKESALFFFEKAPAATFRIIRILCKRIDDLNNTCAVLNSRLPPEHREIVDKPSIQPSTPPEPETVPEPAVATESAVAPKLVTTPASVETVRTDFFPVGHKSYILPDVENDKSILFGKPFDCPICRENFIFPIARRYKLRKESTGYDTRTIYKGINLTHYYAISCPKCMFSSASSVFEKASNKKAAEIINKGKELKQFINLSSSAVDADSIFMRLYLALEFMPLGFRDATPYIAPLWLNISWLYHDCGDEPMEKYAIEQALAAHNKVYTDVALDSRNLQKVCMIIGELSYKIGDVTNARKYFFEARSIKDGLAEFSNMADDRLDDLKNNTYSA